jgi:hypothetical protein
MLSSNAEPTSETPSPNEPQYKRKNKAENPQNRPLKKTTEQIPKKNQIPIPNIPLKPLPLKPKKIFHLIVVDLNSLFKCLFHVVFYTRSECNFVFENLRGIFHHIINVFLVLIVVIFSTRFECSFFSRNRPGFTKTNRDKRTWLLNKT